MSILRGCYRRKNREAKILMTFRNVEYLTPQQLADLARIVQLRDDLRDKSLAKIYGVPLTTIRNVIYHLQLRLQENEDAATGQG